MSSADVIQQYVEYRSSRSELHLNENTPNPSFQQKYNYIRTLRMGLFYTTINGPFLHFWHMSLDRIVLGLGIKHYAKSVVLKVIIDQFMMQPCYTMFFLFTLSLMEGLSFDDIYRRCRTQYFPLVFISWKFWIPMHFITFSLPFKYRALFCDVMRIYWGTVLSYYANVDVTQLKE